MLADTAAVDPYAVLAFEAMLEQGGIPLGHNARPVQPVGARMLQYYGFGAGSGRAQQKQVSEKEEKEEERVPYKQAVQRQVSEIEAPPKPPPPPSPPPPLPPTREFSGKDAPCWIIPTKVSEIRGMLS